MSGWLVEDVHQDKVSTLDDNTGPARGHTQVKWTLPPHIHAQTLSTLLQHWSMAGHTAPLGGFLEDSPGLNHHTTLAPFTPLHFTVHAVSK